MRYQSTRSAAAGANRALHACCVRRARRVTASKALAVFFAALLVFSQLPAVSGSAWADDAAAAGAAVEQQAADSSEQSASQGDQTVDGSFSDAIAAVVESDAQTQTSESDAPAEESAAGSAPEAETAAATAAAAAAANASVDKPMAATDLTYNGKSQTGVEEGEGYTLSGDANAKNAGDYEVVASLQEGYQWSDGGTDDVTLTWSIAKAKLTATYDGETVSPGAEPALGVSVNGFANGETALTAAGYKAPTVTAPASLAEGSYTLTPAGGSATNYDFTYVSGTLSVVSATNGQLKAGTYVITANLSMPGAYNPVIPGATVYVNNPSNPFTDKAGKCPVLDGNSALGVANTTPTSPLTKNAKLVVADDGSKTLELDILNPVFTTQEMGTCADLPDVKADPTPPENSSVWNYGKYPTRISHISVKLTDDQVTGQKSYYFKGSKLYAVPLSLDIAPAGDIALELSVNYSSLPASALPEGVTPLPDTDTDTVDNTTPVTPSDVDNGNTGGSDNGGNDNAEPTASTEIATTSDGHIAAGTYTVSANLWFDKATTGLPLNPHMTNSGFPPSTPVSNNATMTVDSSGHATVTAPVVIQDKVMTINNVWGSSITSFTGSSVTIDLGTPSASQSTFTGTCSSSVTIGWLAKTIAAGIFNGVWDHTWNTNWEVDLGSTLPSSGGGELPEAAQAILNGENGVSSGDDAKASALASAESAADAAAKASDNKGGAKNSGSKSDGIAGAVEDLAEAAASNPAVAVGAGVGIVVVVAAVYAGIIAWRKKRAGTAAGSAAGAAGSAGSAGAAGTAAGAGAANSASKPNPPAEGNQSK